MLRRGPGPARPSPDVEHEWIGSDTELGRFVESAASEEEYFLDTEFHREKTYFPRLALVQIAAGGRTALIDPLATDCRALAPLFDGPGLGVLHAAQQDLDVLTQSIGSIPARIFDTQLAAGFIGYSTPSLVVLASSLLGITLPKGDRLTDWLRRPLTGDQRNYAASDVVHLGDIKSIISRRLDEAGRTEWAAQACEELRVRPVGPVEPFDAWSRVKDIRTVKGRARWAAVHVAAWREDRAAELDIPVRHVMSDVALLGVAQRCPVTVEELAACRGIDGRWFRGEAGRTLLAAVAAGLEASAAGEFRFPVPEGEDLDRTMKHAVTLVGVWVAELARQSDIDPSLLGTRRDIVELLAGNQTARLATGWRADIIGRDIDLLVKGRKALTFTPQGSTSGLRLVDCEPVRGEP